MAPFVALVLLVAAGSAGTKAAEPAEKVLIRSAKPYSGLVSRVQSLGGRVTHQYRYLDAVAAEVPRGGLAELRRAVGAAAVTKDEEIAAPTGGDTARDKGGYVAEDDAQQIPFDDAAAIGAEELPTLAGEQPAAYLVNNAIANVSPLHAAGITGAGVVVAVIDSGIRPGFPHISLDGSVIGCEDFVGDALGCSNFANSGHGTFVAGMISANVNFTFAAASALRLAVLAECPACFANPPTNTQIPMIGTAPFSSIYALRVFGATGGSPTSRILAAVERVIELRELFDAGEPGGVDVQVVNMSLGGPTFFAGRDLFDTAVDVLIEKGMVPVIAAGNAGPSSLTVGSPGSAFSAVTVGAASLAHNERILRRAQFGPAVGSLYRPFLGHQTSYFSSRGPHADGRPDPDVTSNGFACYGQGTGGTTGTISLGSGTSFATPSVAGVAALLRQAVPGATAKQIRNAILASANPGLLSDGSTYLDQGAGYVDALAARNLLATGTVPDSLPPPGSFNKSVKVNVEKKTFLDVRDGLVQESVSGLRPGERHDILYRVHPNTSQVVVVLSNVTPALPPSQQNQLFGDDVLLAVHTAKTSSIGDGDYPVFAFTVGGTFAVDDPERGIMRVTVNGDWTNAGEVSADVTIFSTTEPLPKFTAQGKIGPFQTLVYPVQVPAGVAQAEFRLGWREDWSSYPTNDIDLILVAPGGAVNVAGATARNPEVAVVDNPAAGQWLALVDGFELNTGDDRFELRVSLDGTVVK
jgi:subtilisin family serine protease